MKTPKKRITRELRRFPRPHEARNFNKRSLLPTPGHAGTATWNRSPQEWLLPLYKVELTILLNKEGICPKPRKALTRIKRYRRVPHLCAFSAQRWDSIALSHLGFWSVPKNLKST